MSIVFFKNEQAKKAFEHFNISAFLKKHGKTAAEPKVKLHKNGRQRRFETLLSLSLRPAKPKMDWADIFQTGSTS